MKLSVITNNPTLKTLENNVSELKDLSEAVRLTEEVNRMLSDKEKLTQEEINQLKVIRQRIYDRKKKLPDENTSDLYNSDERQVLKGNSFVNLSNKRDWKNIYIVTSFSVLSVVSLAFIFIQSYPLYSSLNFTFPILCTIGSLMIMVGFSVLHAYKPTKMTWLLCAYATLYEIAIVCFGTHYDQKTLVEDIIKSDESYQLMQYKVDQSKEKMEEIRINYDNPTSKAFKNSWYNTKFVIPASETYEKNLNEQISYKKKLISSESHLSETFLKIFYRLGLIILSILSLNILIKKIS